MRVYERESVCVKEGRKGKEAKRRAAKGKERKGEEEGRLPLENNRRCFP